MPKTPAVPCVACFAIACERELQTPATASEQRHPDEDDTRRISRPDGRGKAATADLPSTAKNINVIGRVKLRASATRTAERGVIGSIATDVAGVIHVENQLQVEPKNHGESR